MNTAPATPSPAAEAFTADLIAAMEQLGAPLTDLQKRIIPRFLRVALEKHDAAHAAATGPGIDSATRQGVLDGLETLAQRYLANPTVPDLELLGRVAAMRALLSPPKPSATESAPAS